MGDIPGIALDIERGAAEPLILGQIDARLRNQRPANRRIDHAGRHAVEADSPIAEAIGKADRQPHQPGLRGGIRHRAGAPQREDRRDIDDRPATCLYHRGNDRLGQHERDDEVHRDDSLDLVLCRLKKLRSRISRGIVDEDINTAEAADRLVCDPLAGRRFGEFQREDRCLAAFLLDHPPGFDRPILVAIDQQHGGAFPRHPHGYGFPRSHQCGAVRVLRPCAGHDRNPALQPPTHRFQAFHPANLLI
jgi:hypothetical protein